MMADSDDSAAFRAAVRVFFQAKFNAVRKDLEKEFAKFGDPMKAILDDKKSQDVNASRPSFKGACAVQQSRLLSLPPEVRNMIWKLCLFHPEDLVAKLDAKLDFGRKYGSLTMKIDTGSDEARPKLREAYEGSVAKRTRQLIREYSLRNLALLQTCQAIYNEAAPLLWSQRFSFRSILHLQAFLFSHARLDLVRDIFVENIDRQCGVNYMPAVCALLAEKVKGLERFDVDMSCMDKSGPPVPSWLRFCPFENKAEIRDAGKRLGFDVYSCMYPWVTQVVRDQGIKRLMAILQMPSQTRETPRTRGQSIDLYWRTHRAFKRSRQLSANNLKIAHTAVADEILRLVNLYDK